MISKLRGDRLTTINTFIGYNLALLCALGFAGYIGLFETVWDADISKISTVIVALFAFVLIRSGFKLYEVTHDKIERKDTETFKIRLNSRISFIKNSANYMVVLGLIGTVVGFILALQGVNPDNISGADSVGPMVGSLIQGLGVALYTTLVGAIFHVWTMINYHFIQRASMRHVVRKSE